MSRGNAFGRLPQKAKNSSWTCSTLIARRLLGSLKGALLGCRRQFCPILYGQKEQTPDWKQVFNLFFYKRKEVQKPIASRKQPQKLSSGWFLTMEACIVLITFFILFVFVLIEKSFLLPKTSHRELFGDSLYSSSVCENPLYRKGFSHFPKCSWTIEAFRTLRSATKGSSFGNRELFVKSSTKNFCFSLSNRLCDVGEQCPASS